MRIIIICIKKLTILTLKKSKSNWKKQLHTWHWISSAVSLICMILFAITGITLNHADLFESTAEEFTFETTLSTDQLSALSSTPEPSTRLPQSLIQWIDVHVPHEMNLKKRPIEQSDYEIYIPDPIPGGDRWMSIDLETGDLTYSQTHRGLIAWLNDLHKGRNTSLVWIGFIDIFSIATLVFCITGLVLLQIHSKRRPSTWYITGAGIVIPGLLAWFYTG